jgi:serine/threonine-protein kinase HipA
MIAGESKNPGEKDLLKLAAHFGLANAEQVMEEVKNAISGWETTARDLEISKETVKTISSKLKY